MFDDEFDDIFDTFAFDWDQVPAFVPDWEADCKLEGDPDPEIEVEPELEDPVDFDEGEEKS